MHTVAVDKQLFLDLQKEKSKEGASMQALSTAAPGKVYTIKWMFGLPEVLNIIRNCQIEEGSEIRVFEKFNFSYI